MTTLTTQLLGRDEILLAPELTLLPDGMRREYAVHVKGGVFADVGPRAEVVARHPLQDCHELPGQVLMPGFVDSHHHLTQAFGKALVFGEPSEIFRRVWVPMEQQLDDENAYLATKLSALEWLRGGFTTVADAGTRAQIELTAVASAAQDAGLRCVLAAVQNDLTGDPGPVTARANQHLERWSAYPLVHPSLAVSIPEAASPEVLGALHALSLDAGCTLQIHVNEHLVAVERSLEATGLRPLEFLDRAGALGPALLAAHATLITPYELQRLADTGAAVSYNPVASAWKGNAVAPATAMAAMGIRFGIGTDGTRGDAFRLVDAAETAQRLTVGIATGDSSVGGGWTWLDHATAGSADAVGLGARVGRIAPGYAADYLIVDVTGPEFVPSHDPTWEFVRLANRDQIVAVVVAGVPRMWRGNPVGWDARTLLEDAGRAAEKLLADTAIQVIHPTADEHRRRSR